MWHGPFKCCSVLQCVAVCINHHNFSVLYKTSVYYHKMTVEIIIWCELYNHLYEVYSHCILLQKCSSEATFENADLVKFLNSEPTHYYS